MSLTSIPEYCKLKAHRESIGSLHMRSLFDKDPQRFNKMSIELKGDDGPILFDYSKNIVTEDTLKLLFELASARDVEGMRDKMFGGEKINFTEDRAVLHIALRNRSNTPIMVDGKDLLVVEKRKLLLPSGYTRYFSWGYIDHSARIALVEGDKVISVFEGLQQGRILCGSALDDNTLLTAGESTVIYVWSIRNTSSKDKSPTTLSLKHTLHGHTGPVSCIATSSSYNLIVTGSKDKTCIVWDSNRLLFVRQLKGHVSAITVVTINQLSGNIVTCTRNELRLWTINGVLLAQAELTITGNFRLSCCAVSEMFEWDSDNVILTGSSDGVVRIWRVEYERRNNVGSSADNYPTTPPSIYPDMEYPTMIYPGRPIKLIKTTHDSTPEGDLPLAESSDTESSEAPSRGTGDDTRGEEQEEPPPMPHNDEIRVERQESQGSALNQYIEEAKRKADELREKTGYWKRRLILAHTLTMHTSFQRQDNSSPAAITCITISKDHRRLFIGDALGRIFSWSVTDSLGGVMEHWILDEAVNRCMRCNMEFTLTERKHHCRDCGKIFCARCSDFTSEIERLKISKKVRVCLDCYDKLNNS